MNISNKTAQYFPPHLNCVVALPGKVNSSNLLQILKKMQQEKLIFEHI